MTAIDPTTSTSASNYEAEISLVSELCVAYGFTIDYMLEIGRAPRIKFRMWNNGRAYALSFDPSGAPTAILDDVTSATTRVIAVSSFQPDLRTAVNNVLKRA